MTGTADGVIMLVGGGFMGVMGGLLFANHDGYTQRRLDAPRLWWKRDRPASEARVALLRLVGLLLAVAGTGVCVGGFVLTVRGQGQLLLRETPPPFWLRVPSLLVLASWLRLIVLAHRRRVAPWTAWHWAAAMVWAAGILGAALAFWWGYIAVVVVLVAVTGVAVLLLVRLARTAERPRSPEDEGEQGRSES